ncbi:transcription factor atoh8 [Denticeps clupeoides]|uniref:Protein atonal homolog 8 n=1 Tax=Denticeps clupeoides TaxID=299321 RepID=A0AAY4CZX9_9TELE|nr:protein atonal homolog 8 [Denticeps clupeoides]
MRHGGRFLAPLQIQDDPCPAMRNPHLHADADADAAWKDAHAVRKLKRKSREPLRRAAGGDPAEEPVGGRCAALDMRIGAPQPAQPFPQATSADDHPFPRSRTLLAPAVVVGAAAESPRRRLGDAAGVVTEIKAIQQSRRLLANARERTRVHTISAAFEALRKQVPCYSYGQKLSKLAILRIACNYILSLAQLADLDYTPDHSNMSFRECVEQCTRTLQAEGRSKKRKE